MFKPIFIRRLGMSVTIDEFYLNWWHNALFTFIIETKAYRTTWIYSGQTKKRKILIVDPYVHEPAFNMLTVVGYALFMMCLHDFSRWFKSALAEVGIDDKCITPVQYEEIQNSVIDELFADKGFKARLLQHVESLDASRTEVDDARKKQLILQLTLQAEQDSGLEPIFFTNSKNEVWYTCGTGLYRIKADATDVFLEDPKQLIANLI